MRADSAYLLVAHGSRDRNYREAFAHLGQLVRDRGARPAKTGRKFGDSSALLSESVEPLVETACLELDEIPLHVAMVGAAERARAAGFDCLQVIPLFLLAGVHVCHDIPDEVAHARSQSQIEIYVQPCLGRDPAIAARLDRQFASMKASSRLLLAHGSRRDRAHQPIEAIAAEIGATCAYWSVSPTLAEQVEALAVRGTEAIAIVPYFLFPGGITRAIAEQVERLAREFPYTRLLLGHPLGATPDLADLIVRRMRA